MPTIKWDEVGSRYFETGVDRVVLYSVDGVGVPWNGVTGITEKVEGASSKAVYLDGQKLQEARIYGDYSATLEAFIAPMEFSAHDGTKFGSNGLGFGLQPIKPFGLSYRTIVGNDTDREEHGHKIHLVYNAYATAGERTYSTISDSIEPFISSWDITTIPTKATGIRPTAHLVMDSRKVDPGLLGLIEGYLYGANGIIPRMPTMQQIVDIFAVWTALDYDGTVNFEGIYSTAGTTYTNLATNPSFETTSGTVEVRRNLMANPAPASTPLWGVANGATIAYDSTRKAMALTPAAASNSSGASLLTGVATTVGTVFTVSVEIEASAADTYYITATGATGATSHTLAAGEKRRISAVLTATATSLAFYVVRLNTPGVAPFYLSNALIEQSPTPGLYFDGSTQPKVRRNLAWFRNTLGTIWYTGVSSSITLGLSAESASGPEVAGSSRVYVRASVGTAGTWNNARVGTRIQNRTQSPVGTPIHSSVWVRPSTDLNVRLGFVLYETEIHGGTSTEWLFGSTPVLCPANVWTEVPGDVVATQAFRSAIVAAYVADPSTGQVGDTLDAAHGLFEIGTAGDFFDGSTGAPQGYATAWEGTPNASASYLYDADFTTAWTGAANDSASVLRGEGIPTIGGHASNESKVISSRHWSSAGLCSVRITPSPIGSPDAFAQFGVSVVAGKTYTILATARVSDNPDGTGSSQRTRCINLYGGQAPISGELWGSQVPRNSIGESRLIFTPIASGTVYGRMYSNVLGDVWWDNLLIIEGVYDGPYFDGSNGGIPFQNQGIDPSWNGAANASTSKFVRYSDLPNNALEGDARIIGGKYWVWEDGYWQNKGAVPVIT